MTKFSLKLLLILSVFLSTPAYSLTCNKLFDNQVSLFTKTQNAVIKHKGLFIKIPLYTALGITAWKAFDHYVFWPQAETRSIATTIDHVERNSKYYDTLIEKDFRFYSVKNSKLDDTVVEKDSRLESLETQKRVRAYGIKKAFEEYYVLFSQIKNPYILSLENQLKYFGQNELFMHLDFFFQNGVQRYPGTIVLEKDIGPLSEAQRRELFELTHVLYTRYLINEALFGKSEKESLNVLNKNPLAKEIFYDPYTQQMIFYHQTGKITKEELLYYIQEDSYNQYYMEIFEAMNIVNLKEKSGKYINEPLTLSELRLSRIADINQNN